MIDCFIPSIDRPMQMDLLLRSIRDNFKGIDKVSVLYKYSNNDFMLGYDIVKHKDFDIDIKWIKESNFQRDTKEIFNNFNKKYAVCFVDDEVILRQPDLSKFTIEDHEVGFSLRLGDNFPFAWNAQAKNTIPKFEKTFNVISWKWQGLTGDYGYPFCVNSIIRDTEYFKQIINSINFSAPNNLEMAITKYDMTDKPIMCAFDKPISINIANNLAQNLFKSRTGEDNRYSLENLNKKYLDGYKLDTEGLYDKVFACPTMPVPYNFVKGD